MKYNLVIDADSILYTACYNNQIETDGKLELDSEWAYLDFCGKINKLRGSVFNRVKDEHYRDEYRGKPRYHKFDINIELVFSPKKTFRNSLSEIYKANRKPTEIVGIGDLKQLVYERLGYTQVDNIEADDIVITRANEEKDVFIACIDKDIYTHSPVPCINYNTWEWTEAMSEEDIEEGYIYQSILGDSTDNIKGVKGKGKVFADSFVNNELEPWTYDSWEQLFESSDDALLNMRLVRLDQYKKGELALWEKE